MKKDLLKILRESKDYLSGQQLCEYFGVSRTAVWKVVRQLKEDGYEIEAVKNKGYRIREVPDIMTAAELGSRLHTKWMGRNCICLETVDSTNTHAKRLAEEGAPAGTLVAAEEQTGGKGRRGRGWTASRGVNIMMTLLLRPRIRPEHASRLTLLMAMAVAEGIRKVTGLSAGIKWPNDVVVHGKKVCGILTEMSAELDGIHYVVIGAGINVNQEQMADEIQDKATSLYIEGGKRIKRAELAARVLHYFEINYAVFEKTWDFSGLVDQYNRSLVNRDREVRVLDPKGAYDGIARGINEKGELIVERKSDGQVEHVYAGEVSVRGVNGYV